MTHSSKNPRGRNQLVDKDVDERKNQKSATQGYGLEPTDMVQYEPFVEKVMNLPSSPPFESI